MPTSPDFIYYTPHRNVLQSSDWTPAPGQLSPPTHERVRSLAPVPQLAVHALQLPHSDQYAKNNCLQIYMTYTGC